MNIKDFKKVQGLVEQLSFLKKQTENIYNYLDSEEEIHEYCCHLSKHRDGSGVSFNLSECGVATSVYRAVLTVLEEKTDEVTKELKQYSVTF